MTNFMQQALVFMSASMILVPIFQLMGFGSVLGYLIAGVVVGPYGLELIHDAESVAHFSEFGVVFLLFVIGLEIQPKKLWSMKKDLICLGLIQVLATALIFCFIGKLFGLSLVAASILGFALSLSSTAFALQTLMDKNLFNTEFGRSSFSILLGQDLVAIPALAIIPLLAVAKVNETSSSSGIWMALGVIAGMIIVSRFFIAPIFRMIAESRSREVFTATTLFIVVGVSALMQKVGLSSALGAFIAGVMLADSEYRHELETNIEPFKGLLMGLFFIAVGMGVNLDLLVGSPMQILGLTSLYLLVKWSILYGVGRFNHRNHTTSKLMALNIAQGGEFAFVIFGLVGGLGLVEPSVLSTLTAVITLSMALNPILIMTEESWSAHLKQKTQQAPTYDEIQDESAQVIIAGFGRFGQIFGRILRAQGIPFVAIDHDAAQIDLLRKFGNKVYYGDAGRADLLKAAGAERAKYFILAIDDMELSLSTAKVVKSHFPHLKIFARARNRGHAFELMDLGINLIKREVIDSSVNFVEDLLLDMGFPEARAAKIIERFREHDEIMLQDQYKVREDDKSFVSVAHQGTAQLAQVLSDDNQKSNIKFN